MKRIARIHKALSDETRLRIISLLMTGGELCVCDLMAVLHLPQSTASRHLAYLRDSGLVNDKREGVWMYYRLQENDAFASEVLKSLKVQLQHNKKAEEDRLQLSEYLAAKNIDACSK